MSQQYPHEPRTVKFGTFLPEDLMTRLRIHAANEGIEINRIVRDALDSHLPRVRVVVDERKR